MGSVVPPEARVRLPSRHALKVISYNILAPKYSNYNSYCPRQFLAWDYRRDLVLRELDHHGAHLLGLQECDMEFFNGELQDWMAGRGMQGEFLARQVGPVVGPTEGIALLWRSSALEPVARRSIVFAETDPRVAGLPEEVSGTKPWSKLRDVGEGAVMALLRHRPTGQLLLAAVTHLFWDPAFPDVKALQAALLCGAMASFAWEAGGSVAASAPSAQQQHPQQQGLPVPALLCGDFNSLAVKRLPDTFDTRIPPGGLASGVYTLLSGGSLSPDHPDHPHSRVWRGELQGGAGVPAAERFPAVALSSSGLQLASMSAEAFGREPPLTTRTASWAGCLDYVWFSRSDFAVASALAMPYDDGGRPPMCALPAGEAPAGPDLEPAWRDPMTDISFVSIPDERYPSDHLAVGGEVVLLGGGVAAVR